MKRMPKKNQKKLSVFAIFLIVFLTIPFAPVQALFGVSAPSPTDSMNQVMGDLGVDKTEVRYSTSSFDASRQKKQAPQVSLNFSPTNPVKGQAISVEATPMYFGNADMKDLYYTWYIQHHTGAARGQDSEGRLTEDGNTDWNENGRLCLAEDSDYGNDIEDCKIEAARILASGDFDWQKAQANGAYTSDNDNDGYNAWFGGEDQKNKYGPQTDGKVIDPQCYMHNFKDGNEYKLDECKHLFPNAPGERSGNGTFIQDEELFWRTDPRNSDTAGTSNKDEANVVGLGRSVFSWNYQPGDKVGVALEGISFEPTQDRNSTYKVMWALPKNLCHPESFLGDWASVPAITPNPAPAITQVRACLSANIDATTTTLPVRDCTTGGALNLESWLDQNGYGAAGVGPNWPTDIVRIGGSASTDIGSGLTVTNTPTPTITLAVRDTGVVHLAGTEILGNTITNAETYTRKTAESAGGNQLLVTDTHSGTITIVDQTGNTSYTITDSDTPVENSYTRDFDMQTQDLNECLEGNLTSPAEGNADEKIKVSLTSTPDLPMNDPAGINSDYLEIKATLQNVENTDYLQYDWEVFSSDVANPENWDPVLKPQLVESTQTSGLGIKTLKFKLALNPTPKYLKVRLLVTEKIDTLTRKGSGSLVIPINTSAERIYAYNTTLDQVYGVDAQGVGHYFARDAEICQNNATTAEEKERNAICPVLKNEVIGLEYRGGSANTQYLWTLNDVPLNYSSCYFRECEINNGNQAYSQSNVAYFPILGDVGTAYTIGLSVIDTTSGEKKNFIRTFQVENPSTRIYSADQYAQALLLGWYIGLNNQEYQDFSETKYRAVPGTTVNLLAQRSPFNFPITNNKTQWFVDGQPTNITGNNLSFPVNKPVGSFYTVSFNTLYTQSADKKRLMYEHFGVMPNQFFEIQLTHTIDITMTDSLPGVVVAKGPTSTSGKVLAAVFSGAPAYISFLLRIVLTTLLLLFGSWIFLSFFPVTHKNDG